MTREYFEENICTLEDLFNAMAEEGYELSDEIIAGDNLSSTIDEDLRDVIMDWNWDDIRDSLDDIETGYDYYKRRGILDYEYLTDNYDFSIYAEEFTSWMNDGGYWEDDEDEEEAEDVESAEAEYGVVNVDVFAIQETLPEPPVEVEDFSVAQLFSLSEEAFCEINSIAGAAHEAEACVPLF